MRVLIDMIRPVATRPNPYTGSPLDRLSLRRHDPAWLVARQADPASLLMPVWRGRSLVRGVGEGRPEAVLLAAGEASGLRAAAESELLLGLLEGRAVYALGLAPGEEDAPPDAPGEFIDMRQLAGLLSPHDGALLAHARGLAHWRATTRFCSRCGTRGEAVEGGTTLVCPSCGLQHFPRSDPAVIMLVSLGERCLLGRSARFPPGMYSTLAGFVEHGESVEEAVVREVREEAGLEVREVRYHSSQPWPFPSSLMLGFYAEAEHDRLTLDPAELTDARWVTRAMLADPAPHDFALPRGDSIARRLIEDWMAA